MPVQDTLHLGWIPVSPVPSDVTSLVELRGDFPQGLASIAELLHDRQDVGVRLAGLFCHPRRPDWAAFLGRFPADFAAFWVVGAEQATTGLVRGECCRRPFRDPAGFIFGDGCQDVDGQPVCFGIVAGHEVRAGVHQRGGECHVAGQTVEFGDDQSGSLTAGVGEGFGQVGAIGAFAGFDLGVLSSELAVAVDVLVDDGLLGFEAQSGAALAVGRDAVVGDKGPIFGGFGLHFGVPLQSLDGCPEVCYRADDPDKSKIGVFLQWPTGSEARFKRFASVRWRESFGGICP